MTFLAWPEIQSFHNIRKFLRVDPQDWWRAKEQLSGTSTVEYKSKIKLHGTNAAIQVHTDGTIIAQSRERIITPEDDNAGFARWVDSQKVKWQLTATNVIYYGEWSGPGINKGVAIASIPNKIFAIFAARYLNSTGDELIIEPAELEKLISVTHLKDVYVLPWYKSRNEGKYINFDTVLGINWRNTDEELTKSTTQINDWVMAVETNDPWVEETFGVKGTGEGLVFYPVSKPHLGLLNYSMLTFKAKGELHKNVATAKPAQVNPEVAANVDGFCDMVLTTARLEQGAKATALTQDLYEQKNTGKFISWIQKDVEKECKDELAASGLDWKQVQKALGDKARQWFLIQAKK